MAERAFSVTYDGPALSSGRMPVRDLAPALLELGGLFTEAGQVTYPDREPVALSIKATQEGSFEVYLILEAKKTWDQIVDIFGSDGVTAILNLKEIVLGGLGLFGLIKLLRGKTIVKQEPSPEPGHIRCTFNDGTVVDVPAEVLDLYKNVSIRKHARQVVEPLTSDGAERVVFSDVTVTVAVDSSEVQAFDVPDGTQTPLGEHQATTVLQIAAPSFVDGNKWRFTDGNSTFYAALEDSEFVERVEQGEPFRKGDMLRARSV